MTAKEYLLQYRDAVRRATAAQDHLDELRAMAERITPNYGSSGGGGKQTGDKLGAAVARLVDAEEKVDAEIELMTATAREVRKTIEAVPEPYSTLLYERYINGKTWEQIAVTLNYSFVHVVHRLHPAALRAVQAVIAEVTGQRNAPLRSRS